MTIHEHIEQEMYEIANSMVNSIGPETYTSNCVTGEPYITFCFRFNDPEEVISCWSEWVKNYVSFQKFVKPEGYLIEKDPKLNIFWRKKPEIKIHDKCFTVVARLLISRQDIKA